jgi:hypothetical protein
MSTTLGMEKVLCTSGWFVLLSRDHAYLLISLLRFGLVLALNVNSVGDPRLLSGTIH